MSPESDETTALDKAASDIEALVMERDAFRQGMEAAEAKFRAVEAIHRDEEREKGREPMCLGCGHISPCPTQRALGTPDSQSALLR